MTPAEARAAYDQARRELYTIANEHEETTRRLRTPQRKVAVAAARWDAAERWAS